MAYLVWGKGRSGLAAFNLLKAKGFKAYIGDNKEDKNLWKDVPQHFRGYLFHQKFLKSS